MVPASILPDGNGRFIVTPSKPRLECSTADAAKILGVHRSSLSNIVNYPLAQKLLKWRWTSEKRGKRIFDLASVVAYKDATEDPEFGGE